MSKTKFFFFYISNKSSVLLGPELKRIMKLPVVERTLKISESPMRLSRFEEFENFFIGDVERIQMHEIPTKARVDSDINDKLTLEDDEGLGYQNAFLLDPKKNILVYQNNRNGMGITKFSSYLHTLIKNMEIDFLIIIQGWDECYKKTMSSDSIFKSLEFKVYNPSSLGDDLSGMNDSSIVSTYLNAAAAAKAPFSTVKLSVERRSEFLDAPVVRQVISFFNKKNAKNNLEKLEVKGVFDNQDENLNFLAGKLLYEESIESMRQTISYEDRKQAVLRAYQSQEMWIKAHVSSK